MSITIVVSSMLSVVILLFFNPTSSTDIYTLSYTTLFRSFRSAARDRQAPSKRCRGVAAFRVPPATRADSLLLASLRGDVVHDVIRACWISTHSRGYVIQTQVIPGSPRDVVIRAGAVATHAEGADQDVGAVVYSESASEDIHTTDTMSHHGVTAGAKVRCRTKVSHRGVHRIAVLQAVKAAARLDCRVQVGRG